MAAEAALEVAAEGLVARALHAVAAEVAAEGLAGAP